MSINNNNADTNSNAPNASEDANGNVLNSNLAPSTNESNLLSSDHQQTNPAPSSASQSEQATQATQAMSQALPTPLQAIDMQQPAQSQTSTTPSHGLSPAQTGVPASSAPTAVVSSAPLLDPPAPQSQSENAQPASESNSGRANSAHPNPSRAYWCHECRTEITPMMVPDPMCPNCHSEFVEEIDPGNDPRTFVGATPAPPHLTGDSQRSRSPSAQTGHAHDTVNLEDLFRLFQAFAAPQRTALHQQRTPDQTHTSGIQYTFFPGGSTTTARTQSSNPTPPPASQTRQSTESSPEGQQNQSLGPQWHSPPSFLAGLLNQFGIEFHYTTDPSALGGFGGAGMGGRMFGMAGNPGDYVHGQSGIDDIISQMMELQNRQHGPVGATEEIINSIPKHELTDAELAAKTDCSVCKDDFAKEDNLLQLPCNHIFHDDCIKPWLKVSGTCPTCRFSLVDRNSNTSNSNTSNTSGVSRHPAPNPGSNGATGAGSTSTATTTSTTSLPGAFPSSGSAGGATNNNSNVESSLPHSEPLD